MKRRIMRHLISVFTVRKCIRTNIGTCPIDKYLVRVDLSNEQNKSEGKNIKKKEKEWKDE